MSSDYVLEGGAFYGMHHGRNHYNQTHTIGEEQNTFVGGGAGDEDYVQPRRLYQPPKESKYPYVHENPEHADKVAGEAFKETILNDNEFLSLAKSILSVMEKDEVMMKPTNQERSNSATAALRKVLPLDTLQKFNEALDSRLALMPKHPSWGESHDCTIVRRCEGIFGEELKALLKNFDRVNDNDQSEETRQDQNSGVAFMNRQQERYGTGTRVAPEDIPTINGNRYVVKDSSPQKSQGHSKNTAYEAEFDLTSHIVWGEETKRNGHTEKELSHKDTNIISETTSTSSSNYNESEVYDMFVDSKPNECAKQKETGYTVQAAHAKPIVEDDDDEKSVASMYSLSREKSLISNKANNRKFVSVRAPETLPGNFMFEARMNDDIFMVHVPKGGVKKGEIFQSPVLNLDSTSVFDPTGRTKRLTDMHTPDNQWRSGFFNIFAHGILHPMTINSFLCTHVSLAQVMTRLQLDTAGNKTTSLRSRVNFNVVKVFPVIILLFHGVLFFLMYRAFHLHLKNQLWVFIYSSIPILIADLILFGYFIHLTAKVRRLVRQEYNIEENECLGYGDEILSCFCAPFVVAQMGRHTADYDTYVGTFCTKTGLSNHIEVKLPSDVEEYHAMGSSVV